MSADLLAGLAARADDLGPVVELRITVELRRWQAAEVLGLLEAGREGAAATVLGQHALHARRGAAAGEALLLYGAAVVPDIESGLFPRDGDPWRADSTAVADDPAGPVIDLVHPARAQAALAAYSAGDDVIRLTPAATGDDQPPSRWMATFTAQPSPC